MAKDIRSIIEEHREMADDIRDWHDVWVELSTGRSMPEVNPQTAVLLYNLIKPEQVEKFDSHQWSSVPELADKIRSIVEREVVESVEHTTGDLVLSIAFSALHEVDWEALAILLASRLRERKELLERARESGLPTHIEAEDDLPKN